MRRLFTLCLGAFLAIALAACGGGGSGSSSSPAATLRYGVSYADTTLDPDLIPIQQMWVYLDPVYDSLTLLDHDKQVQPQLATEWTAGQDGGNYYLDMKLKTGLEFPDGAPFGADTVLANVKRSVELEGSTNAPWFAGITVEKKADDEVRFISKTGVGQLPAILAGPAGMMISQKAIEAKKDLSKTSYGIAPYQVTSVSPNRIAYTRNDNYWNKGVAAVKNLEAVYMSDDAMLSGVLSGDVHVAYLPYRMVETASKSGFVKSVEPGNVNLMFAINATIKPFDDPRVREAMSLALDRKTFCDSVWNGQCTPASQFFGPRVPSYDESAAPLPFDLDKAKALVKAAGADGTKAELVMPAGIQQQVEMATYAQGQWKKIGLNIKVTQIPPAQVVGRFTQEKNAAITHGGAGLAFDPSIEISRYVLASGLYNIGKQVNPKVEQLAAQGRVETDAAKRDTIYKQISTLVVGDHLLVPFETPHNSFVVSPKVKGWSQPWGGTFNTMRGVSLGD
jgi:peptide/nickel transport system substrate-binding protein